MEFWKSRDFRESEFELLVGVCAMRDAVFVVCPPCAHSTQHTTTAPPCRCSRAATPPIGSGSGVFPLSSFHAIVSKNAEAETFQCRIQALQSLPVIAPQPIQKQLDLDGAHGQRQPHLSHN